MTSHRLRSRNRVVRAFTLIEVLVVMTIIGILIALRCQSCKRRERLDAARPAKLMSASSRSEFSIS